MRFRVYRPALGHWGQRAARPAVEQVNTPEIEEETQAEADAFVRRVFGSVYFAVPVEESKNT